MKWIVTISLLFLFAVSCYIFVGTAATKPPQPYITVDNETIPVTQGSYCWSGKFSAECADTGFSSAYEMGLFQQPVTVKPGEAIKLSFNNEPNELSVELWSSPENIMMSNAPLIVPNDPGVYVFHLIGHWDEGDGNFAFSIKVN